MAQTTGSETVAIIDIDTTLFNQRLDVASDKLDTLAQIAAQTGSSLMQTERMRENYQRTAASSPNGSSHSAWENVQQGVETFDTLKNLGSIFTSIPGALAPAGAAISGVAAATGALLYSFYQGDKTLSDFNRTLVLTGSQSGLTAQGMLEIANAGVSAGLTFSQSEQALTALVAAGVTSGSNFDLMTAAVARFTDASGTPLEIVAAAFAGLTNDPTSGLIAMAEQFHNVTAEQIDYVAQLQQSGDQTRALQAANEIAAKGFDDQTQSIESNMGLLERSARSIGKMFSAMWDSILDVGRPETLKQSLDKAEQEYIRKEKSWSLEKNSHYLFRNPQVEPLLYDQMMKAKQRRDELRQDYDDDTNAQLAKKNEAERESAKLSYQRQAQAFSGRNQSALETFNQRKKELEEALALENIMQRDYETLMNEAKQTFRRQDRQQPSASRQAAPAGLTQIVVKSPQTTQSAASESFEERQRKETEQYLQQMREKAKNLIDTSGLSEREAQRFNQLTEMGGHLVDGRWRGDSPYQQERIDGQLAFFDVEDKNRGDFVKGAQAAWNDYVDAAGDAYGKMKSFATATFDSISQNMLSMLTTGKANWADFAHSTLSMMTQLLAQQALSGLGKGLSEWFSLSSSGSGVLSSVAKFLGFTEGGYTGPGGKYAPAGVVHRGEFVFTQEATQRIGVGNLYRMMRGYAEGGYVGEGPSTYSGGVSIYAPVTVNGGPQASETEVGSAQVGRAYQQVINQSIQEGIANAIRPGGLIWNATNRRG